MTNPDGVRSAGASGRTPGAGARVHVAVDLRRRERAVAEQLLDHAQVGAALEQVRGEGVPEAVRVREQAAERARVEPPAARREEQRVLGAARELGPRVAEVPREPVAPPPRRAGRRAPCRPCRERAPAPARSRRRRGRDRPPRGCAGRPSRRARRARGCGARGARRPRAPRAAASTSAGFGASRQPPRPARGERDVGHAAGAEREAEQRAHGGELARDRRRREPARPAPARAPRRTSASTRTSTSSSARPRRVEPAANWLEVDAVGAARRVGERRAREEAVDLVPHA